MRLFPMRLRNKWIESLRNKLPETTAEAKRAALAAHWDEVEKQIPKFRLLPKHVANTRILPEREDLIARLPQNAVVAELGVNRGDFSQKIWNIAQPAKFHIVDCWPNERYHSGLRAVVEGKFTDQIKDGRVEINYGLSTAVVSDFPDAYFDWIYIDTDHSYEVTRDELEAYRTKMKPGGIIAGHDYIQGYWRDMVRYGVIEAVYEFCVKYNWEILYITTELEEHPSFAIREISE